MKKHTYKNTSKKMLDRLIIRLQEQYNISEEDIVKILDEEKQTAKNIKG